MNLHWTRWWCGNFCLVQDQWNRQSWLPEETKHISTVIDDMGSGKGHGEMAVISSAGGHWNFEHFCHSINWKEVWWCWGYFSGWWCILPQNKEQSDFSLGATYQLSDMSSKQSGLPSEWNYENAKVDKWIKPPWQGSILQKSLYISISLHI